MGSGFALVTGVALLGLLTTTSVEAIGDRSGHHGRRLGNCSLLQGTERHRCFLARSTVRRIQDVVIATILVKYNLECVPKDCEGKDASNLEACLQDWDIKQILAGVSDTKIPQECQGLKKENQLKKCLKEYTLRPTSYPSYAPTSKSPTKSPTLTPIHSDSFVSTTSSSFEVLDIGEFVMSLTTYSQTSREITSEVLNRDYEMTAARQHLREVYEDSFKIPVVSIDLQFVDGGLTVLSKSDLIRHSSFFGNVTFDDSDSLPTLAQLETETLQAFTGEQKEAFLKKYHFLATGATSYFEVKYKYDVSVRMLNDINNYNNAAAQEEQGVIGMKDAVGTSGMFVGVMIVFVFVLFVTMIGLAVLIRRKRRLDRVPSAQNIYEDFEIQDIDLGSKVGSDVSLSPLQLLEDGDDTSSSENISRLGIDLSPTDSDNDDKPKDLSESRAGGEGGGGSTWSFDSKEGKPYIDIELEIGSTCRELLSGKKA
jgi:hypothetical protein